MTHALIGDVLYPGFCHFGVTRRARGPRIQPLTGIIGDQRPPSPGRFAPRHGGIDRERADAAARVGGDEAAHCLGRLAPTDGTRAVAAGAGPKSGSRGERMAGFAGFFLVPADVAI
jgi:hypothetical protein